MKTFKDMTRAGEIKRADAMKVQIEDLHEEPGFNLRAEGEDLEASIAALAEFIFDGGQIPALEVRPREEGGVWLVDGHRRLRAMRKLDAAGRLPRVPRKDDPAKLEAWVSVVAFTGNDADRVARVITSQEGRKLEPLELARGYQRLAAFGWTPERIAQKVGKSRQHVDQMSILSSGNSDVQQLVESGGVSSAEAVKAIRKHGDEAGKVLGAELDKAKAAGKTKVTASTISGPKVPRGLLDDLHSSVTRLHGGLTTDDRVLVERFHRGEVTEGAVSVPVEHLLHLHLILEESSRIIADLETKAREKADKAKQLELEE